MIPTIDNVVAAIGRFNYAYSSEEMLQFALADVLATAGLPVEREVRLTPADRIDMMVGRVGVEVKVDGSAASVARQLARYALSDQVDALVLVSGRARHGVVPAVLNAKPVRVVSLSLGAL